MKKHIVALIMVLALLAAVIPMQAMADGIFPEITVNKGASTAAIEKGGSGQISLTITPSRRSQERCAVTFIDSDSDIVGEYTTGDLENTTIRNRYITVAIDTDAMSMKTGEYTANIWMLSLNQSTKQWEVSSDIKTFAFEVVSSDCGDDHDLRKVSEVKATCSKTGTIKYICRDCGHVVLEETPTTDHDFKFDPTWPYTVLPTSTSAGEGRYVCATCPAADAAHKIVAIPSSAVVKITSQPKSVTTAAGSSARFAVVATGEDLSYQWQYRHADETEWNDVGSGRSYLTVTNQVSKHENQYRCVVTDVFGNEETSSKATLRVSGRASITTQPKDAWAYDGQKATVSVKATGEDLEYAWYFRNADDTDFTKSTITSSTYSLTMNEERDGREVYCVVTAKNGTTVKSETVTLDTRYAVKISKHPVSVTAHEGDQVVFTVVAATKDGQSLKYQWYYRNEGSSTWKESSCTDAVYAINLTLDRDGREVYCKVKDEYGNTVSSKTAEMKLVEVKITKQPSSTTASAGDMATFRVEAVGDGLKYQWYYRNSGSSSWTKGGSTSDTYTTEMKESRDGREIRCIVTDKYGKTATSNTVTMKLTPVKITEQPKSAKAFADETITLSIGATGDGLKYTWYYKNPGMSSYKASTVTEPTISVKMNEDRDGRKMYCVVKDQYGRKVTSNTVTLSMKETVKITSQPKNQTKDEGETAKFTVKATGDGLKYQWQYSDDGSTWKNASSTSATYSTTAKASRDGRKIRCLVKDKYGNEKYTNTVKLNVE